MWLIITSLLSCFHVAFLQWTVGKERREVSRINSQYYEKWSCNIMRKEVVNSDYKNKDVILLFHYITKGKVKDY